MYPLLPFNPINMRTGLYTGIDFFRSIAVSQVPNNLVNIIVQWNPYKGHL